jgi:quinol-cytochrome oxidoreductase complex cytochrome b subunit
MLLSWLGQQPVEDPYITLGQLASVYFFVYFLVMVPLLGRIEQVLLTHPVRQTSVA